MPLLAEPVTVEQTDFAGAEASPDSVRCRFRRDAGRGRGQPGKPGTIEELVLDGARAGRLFRADSRTSYPNDANGVRLSLDRRVRATTLYYNTTSPPTDIMPKPVLLIAIADLGGSSLKLR